MEKTILIINAVSCAALAAFVSGSLFKLGAEIILIWPRVKRLDEQEKQFNKLIEMQMKILDEANACYEHGHTAPVREGGE